MRFGVLGPVRAYTDDGDAVRVPERGVRALLAALLAHRGWPVSADRLVEWLWDVRERPGSPERALQRRVWALRRALEAAESGARDLIRHRSPGYLLDTPPETVDAERFQRTVEAARDTGDPLTRTRLLTEALELWRGPAYADVADEEFARPLIARLEERRLAAREEQALARLDLGEHRRVVDGLGELVAEHPLRERLVAAHMRALYEGGRQAEALAAHTALAERLREELGVDPGPEVAELYGRILRQEPPATPRDPDTGEASTGTGSRPTGTDAPAPAPAGTERTRLPLPLTELVGREADMDRVRRLLADGRLVTLTGIGGVGKTRLATEIAHERAPESDDVYMAEFAAQRAPTGIVPDPVTTLAGALGIRDVGGDTVQRMLCALDGRRVLLVLDNCEHLAEEVADLVAPLLGRLPRLRVLATSREPLGVPGEVLYEVEPLDVPPADPGRVDESGAVRLFAARAAASAPGFALTSDNAADVALLCRRLDGIPLALELAATRVRALGVTGVLRRLDDRFRLLSTAQRHLPPRQRTLRAMIDWSWELLDEPERVLLRRLSVFSGGCAPEDAEAVCSGDGLDAADVMDLLTRLVDRSLVVAVDDPDTGRCHRLLESIADYACQRLSEAGEVHDLRRRHLAHYTALAERHSDQLLDASQGHALRRLDAETGNLHAALDEAVERGDAAHALRLVNSLGWYWYLRGRYREGHRVLEHALRVDRGAASSAAATAEATAAAFAILVGTDGDHTARSRAVLKTFDDLPDAHGDDVALQRARASWILGFVLHGRGDRATGEDLVVQALPVFRERRDRWGLAATLLARASHALARGDLDEVRAKGREALDLFRSLGDQWGQMNTLVMLGVRAEVTGARADAVRLRREALDMAEELELWAEAAGALAGLGRIALLEGDHDRADDLHRQSLDLVRGQGDVAGEQYARIGLGISARRRGRLEEAERHARPMMEWSTRVGWLPGTALSLAELGFTAELRGEAAEALRLHLRGLAAARDSADPRAVALALEGVAAAHTLTGRHGAAARLLGTAEAVREGVGTPMPDSERADVDRAAARARAALGEEAFANALARGRKRCLTELFAGERPDPDLV